MQRVIPQPGFAFLGLRKVSPIPNAAVTKSFSVTTANDPISELREVAAHTWLDKRDNVSAIYEHLFVQEEGWAMTLLLVDENEEDGEGNDREWNRRSSRFTIQWAIGSSGRRQTSAKLQKSPVGTLAG